MKILFKNTTKYTEENCNNFIEFHSNKYGKKELLKMIVFGICIIYMVVFNIIYKNWLLIFGAIAILAILYLVRIRKSEKKRKRTKKLKEFTFCFYENYIKIKCKRQFERLTYFSLHKVFETDKYFFLYLDEKSSLILSKEGFEIGTARGFSKFIKSKCPLKYTNENK